MEAQRAGRDAGRRLRADARRNIDAILDATVSCLARDPDATIAEIARTAGVGRQTLYGHFPARADLIDAVVEHVTVTANATLDAVDTGGDPDLALRRLVISSWRVVHRYRAVLAAAERELPRRRLREHHDRHEERLGALLTRGRELGAFRADTPLGWQVAACFALMHAAAAEVMAGRLDEDEAERAVVRTVQAACAAEP
ncbi:TetR/AcrR family transcriptional regulator [Myceligenerans xiligouense]|uniref:TetR family transcriptional regulator n=1 Tax=Myceligenerans xiligouense TaxID=253184 RepID=A0A3N4YM79_9MICO|nr:TetR/AcrR family transcriptional regulator [Myceligenerans xiligouense]RPF20424.1 TetR family transcriptional regulator [Myceligenerans xiligouense]